MSMVEGYEFEKDFWKSFSGEKRLSELLTHFASKFSQTMNIYKKTFAEYIIGNELIGKQLDSRKLLEFVEKELEKIEVKHVIPNTSIPTQKQSKITIYEVDRLTGTQFEQLMAILLNVNGYTDAEVTGKAGDQGGDIITQKDDQKLIIQAKNYSINRKVTNSAVQEVLGAIPYYGADKGIVVTNSFFTASATELAQVNNITLWDRRKVTEMLEVYNGGNSNE